MAPVAAELVQQAGQLAGVAAALRGLLLELIDLLENEDREDHLVVGELEDRPRVVDQDVGVQDEVFQGTLARTATRAAARAARLEVR